MSLVDFVQETVNHITHHQQDEPLNAPDLVEPTTIPAAQDTQDTYPSFDDARMEMQRQVAKWGIQDHLSYTPDTVFDVGTSNADDAKRFCNRKATSGLVSWTDIFAEEVLEAIEEAKNGDLEKLDTELVQCIAVAQSWRESIKRNKR
jgi:ubiquinone/menaquinone biosynthesis C-methylase UbiE